MRAAASLIFILIATGCPAADCLLGISHGDCGTEATTFPQDDASCRSYGLMRGTHDYAVCRAAKAHERKLTRDETGFSFLRNPLLPDLR